jgi:cyclopropane fatty-acyl-phospholipid synthase-like methyltransferase
MSDQDLRQSFSERYANGAIPWDNELPPPELIALADEIEPGRALDLGCGYGRTAVYLALRGWHVDGVDFVEQAAAEARRRAEESNVEKLAQFCAGDVSNLDFLQSNYDLAVDIGCLHTLKGSAVESYRDGLHRLLNKGGNYLLFAHLRDLDSDSEDADRWIDKNTILNTFADGFMLFEVEHGITTVADKPPWLSAWFHFKRL